MRHGQHVCQSHLPRLVDEQYVHRLKRRLRRPQPRGSAHNVCSSGLQRLPRLLAFPGDRDFLGPCLFVGPLHALHILLIGFMCRVHNLFEQFPDYFVTERRNPNLFSLFYQIANHPRAGERFPRAGRPLYGKHRIFQSRNNPARCGPGTLPRARFQGFSFSEPWPLAQQQIAPRAMSTFGVDAVGRHPRADPEKRLRVPLHAKRPVPHVHRGRMELHGLFRFFDIDCAPDQIHFEHPPELFTLAVQVFLGARFRFLFLKGVAIYRNVSLRLQALQELQSR